MLTFKEHQIILNDNLLDDYVELEEAAIVDMLKNVKSSVFSTLGGAASSLQKYTDDVKQFVLDQWKMNKEEILLTLVDILTDIQDEQVVGLVKTIIKISPLPTIIKKILLRLVSSKVASRGMVRPFNNLLRDNIANIIEKNDALKIALVKYKNDLIKMKEEVNRKKYERLQIQAMINFGHITASEGEALLKSGQLSKIELQKATKVVGKPHFKIKG